MKILDRILIVLFTLCLFVVSIWASAVPIAKSKIFYQIQFHLNGIYSYQEEDGEVVQNLFKHRDGINTRYPSEGYAYFTDEQLDIMIDHIIDFLFGNKESFELELEGIEYYNEETGHYEISSEKLSVFGDKAVTHMNDVKELFIIFQVVAVVAFVLALGILAYLLIRIAQVRKVMFEYTMLFYGAFITLISVFLIFTFITFFKDGSYSLTVDSFLNHAWGEFHIFFFPFDEAKREGSMLSDILIEILTLELFIWAVVLVVFVVITVQVIWLAFCLFVKIYGGQIGNKIKQHQYSSAIAFAKENTPQNN